MGPYGACVRPPCRRATRRPVARERSWILGMATPLTSTGHWEPLGTGNPTGKPTDDGFRKPTWPSLFGIPVVFVCICCIPMFCQWCSAMSVHLETFIENQVAAQAFDLVKWRTSSDSPCALEIWASLHKPFLGESWKLRVKVRVVGPFKWRSRATGFLKYFQAYIRELGNTGLYSVLLPLTSFLTTNLYVVLAISSNIPPMNTQVQHKEPRSKHFRAKSQLGGVKNWRFVWQCKTANTMV